MHSCAHSTLQINSVHALTYLRINVCTYECNVHMTIHTYMHIHTCIHIHILLYFWRALSEAACDSVLLHFSLVNYATARIVIAYAHIYTHTYMHKYLHSILYVCKSGEHLSCGGYGTHGDDNFICMHICMCM